MVPVPTVFKIISMLKISWRKRYLHFSVAFTMMLLLFTTVARAQRHQKDSSLLTKSLANDSLLPVLVNKVASYTSIIDHTDFLIRRKFDITPISLNMPEIEQMIKGFKNRLEKNGSRMNLRSLNSGDILLTEIADNLTGYQTILTNFSNELSQSHTEIKKILRDPVLNAEMLDSVLEEQLDDIQIEGKTLDSLQKISITKVNLLRNKVSVNLLQARDILSDMRYLNISLKIGIWKPEEDPLLTAHRHKYSSTLPDISRNAIVVSGKIIVIYLDKKWDVITLGLIIFMFIFFWTWLNMRKVKKQPNAASLLEPVHFLSRGVLISCLMVLFTYLPFLFANPPMALLHALELLRLIPLIWLLYPYLTKQSRVGWILLCILWVTYAFDDIFLESALGERWVLFIAGLILAALVIKIIFQKAPIFNKIPESPATKALSIFTLVQVLLSIIFNLTGRAALAKIFGVSAIQGLMLGITLKVFCELVMESVYLQSEAYQDSRFSDFINFNTVKQRLSGMLWILGSIVWIITLSRSLTLYDATIGLISTLFSTPRTIGNMTFTYESVAIFFFIIWLSSVISGFINFFFGNQKQNKPGKRSKIGSMMLLIRLAIWILGFFIAVAAAGIPIDKLSIMIGALGVGIGFGLQSIVNNLVSGVIIAFERPIQVGDLIEVGGKLGVVKEIGVRSSKINNNAGADIIIPNGDLLSQHLINWTMQDRSKQIEFMLGIPYDSDIKNVQKIILDTLAGNEEIMTTPIPAIVVNQFGEKTLDLKIQFWVYDLANGGPARTKAMIDIYEKLSQSGIHLPVSTEVFTTPEKTKPPEE
jgi:potassium efflux system protein